MIELVDILRFLGKLEFVEFAVDIREFSAKLKHAHLVGVRVQVFLKGLEHLYALLVHQHHSVFVGLKPG